MKAGWLAQQQAAVVSAAARRKPPAAAEAQPAGEATIAALRRLSPAPQPLPSVSPEASQRSAAQAWMPAGGAGLQGGEDEDAVLIGSAAPSFSLPHAQAPPPQPPHDAPGSGSASPPRRSSLLPSQLGSEDLSLTALAAASRRVTRYSSASGGSSLPSTQGSRAASAGAAASESAADAAEPDAGEPYAADFEVESPGVSLQLAPARPTAGQAARLSSDELALLRQSLLELRLPAGLGGGADRSAPGVHLSGELAGTQEIPDQVVLRELGARLGRLDSAKRRVLLRVLAKLDAAPDAPALERRGGSSSGSGRASAVAGAPAAAGQGASQLGAGSISSGSRTSSRDSAAVPPAKAAEQPPSVDAAPATQPSPGSVGQPAGMAATSPAAAPPAAPAAQQSPSKAGGLLSRLAALRLGRTSSLGKAGSSAAAALQPPSPARPGSQAAAVPAVMHVQHPDQPRGSSSGSSLGHSASASSLQGLVQQRHRERSRLSVDGLHSGRQQAVGPAAAVAALHGSQASRAGAGDALAAFEEQHAGEELPLALSASPTVLALGGWHQQAEHESGSRGRSGSGGSEGAAFAIPACPAGRVLELRISSTWGDQHFVGLTGIELFDSHGQLLTVR